MNRFIDDDNKKLLKTLGIVVSIIILIVILIVVIANIILGNSLDYSQIEDKMISASKSYLKDHKDLLPTNNDYETEITSNILSENGYMKTLSKYQKDKSVTCTGTVTVTKNEEYYNYSPYLECGDKYTTTYFFEKLLENVVKKGDGLYKVTQYTNSKKNENVHVFRGEYINNYVYVNDELWQIIKINNKHDIEIIKSEHKKNAEEKSVWDDRYNIESGFNEGVNDYSKSIIKEKLSSYYSQKFSDKFKMMIKPSSICIGMRKKDENNNTGKIECSNVFEKQNIALLNTYDFINASLDTNCKNTTDKSCMNYNYLSKYEEEFWLQNTNADSTSKGYTANKSIREEVLASQRYIRPVVNITKNTVYVSGSGTYNDPYIIK